MLDSFTQPMKYEGTYTTDRRRSNNWAGFYYRERLNYYPWISTPGYHLGVDYNHGTDDEGDPVYAIGNGVVEYTGASRAYGTIVTIRHQLNPRLARELGTDVLISLYGHVKGIKVRSGQAVTKGQQICQVGRSGTQWAHLHLETYKPHNYDAVRSIQPIYPADNTANLDANYFDPYLLIEKYKTPQGDDEVFRTDEEVKQAYLLLRGSVGTAAERAGWIGQSKQRFFVVAKPEADSIRKQLADVKAALKRLQDQPPKTIVKEVEKIVEVPVEKITVKEVEVIKEVEVVKEVNPSWLEAVRNFLNKFLRGDK